MFFLDHLSLLQRFQSEEHLLIHRHKHEMTLKFSSIKNDAAFTGKIRQGARVERSLSRVGAEKEKRFLLKCKVRENYDFFDYVMSVFAAHLHLVLKYDIFS